MTTSIEWARGFARRMDESGLDRMDIARAAGRYSEWWPKAHRRALRGATLKPETIAALEEALAKAKASTIKAGAEQECNCAPPTTTKTSLPAGLDCDDALLHPEPNIFATDDPVSKWRPAVRRIGMALIWTLAAIGAATIAALAMTFVVLP